MPVIISLDSKGCFVRWGKSGKKYYYKCGSKVARERAKLKAEKQARAIYSSGYRG